MEDLEYLRFITPTATLQRGAEEPIIPDSEKHLVDPDSEECIVCSYGLTDDNPIARGKCYGVYNYLPCAIY